MNLLSHLSVNVLLCQVLKSTENTGFEKPPRPSTLSRGAERLCLSPECPSSAMAAPSHSRAGAFCSPSWTEPHYSSHSPQQQSMATPLQGWGLQSQERPLLHQALPPAWLASLHPSRTRLADGRKVLKPSVLSCRQNISPCSGSWGSLGPRAAGQFLIQGFLSCWMCPEGSGVSAHQPRWVSGAGGGVWLCRGGGSSLSGLRHCSLPIWGLEGTGNPTPCCG